MKSRYDLHIHSTFSDGEDDVDALIEKMKSEGITTFSITDHDNIDSINYLKNKNLEKINYISGVEISSYYKKLGIHILGYYIDGNTKALKRLLIKINQRRKKRMKEILKKLKLRNGITLSDDDFEILMNGNNIGKKTLSKILVKKNLGNDYKEIRNNYLSNMNCKVSYRANIKKVCDVIKTAGGIPVLAHPKEIELRYNVKLDTIISSLIKFGINGIEVYNSIHTDEDIKRYLEIANKYNLLISGGSDYHGSNKAKLGLLMKEDYNLDYTNFSIFRGK